MSRSRLEEIIKKLDLYPTERASTSIQSSVEKMRKNIDVQLKKSGRRESITSFRVSFEGKEPKKVRDVAAALAGLFIQYNSKLRQEQAAGTSKFLASELVKVKEELRLWEHRVREFKQKHVGFLPEHMESNYRIMTQLQQRLDSLNTNLQKTQDRRVILQRTFQEEALTAGARDEQPKTLNGLRQQLQNLQIRYSDRHPDVIRLKALIEKLEKQKQINMSRAKSDRSDEKSMSEAERLMSAEKEERFDELNLIEKEIFALRKEIGETESQIDKYRLRIERGPEIEAMFVDLRRGYEQASANYQSLYQKKLQADLAKNLEQTQKGEQFRIQDHAHLPSSPYKPDLRKILSVGLMLALGTGFGLALLREYFDPSFWSRREVESMLEFPVLVSIPLIQTKRERELKMVKTAAAVCILLAMSSTLGYALYVLWQKSPGFIPLPL
jgi:polysaccharide chain length determinant protein (PEP-CTERM system associated)